MDIRLLTAEPSDAEREAIDAVAGAPEANGHRVARADRHRRHLLLPALRAAQRRVGWVSEGALGYACRRLDVPPADAYGVASFYALIALEERPADVMHVCTDLACRLAGANVPEGAHASPCLGLCERAPAALRTIAGEQPREIQLPERGPALPQAGEPGLRLLRRIAAGLDPESLDSYRAHGGYAALDRALELGRDGVIHEVAESHLLGRGGAAFPTGTKWEAVARQPAQPHYLVCNADESEPGTFKDRVLMESDPFCLVEAMTIAAYATGCEHGLVYVRAEYPLAHARLENAFAQARAAGLLGDDVLGAGFSFDIELRIGAGAYVCGEETALFQSIEGYRGEPRNKPPFPVEVGLFGKPTVVNNVETLFNVPEILVGDGTRTRGCSASPATSSGRDCTSCRWARRCRSCSTSPGRGRRRRCCSAARRGRSCGPTSSTSSSPSRRRARPVCRSAPASCSSTTSRRISSTPCCASPSSSATSRAASASPVASGPCARRRRCTGSRPARATATSSRCSPTWSR